MGTRRPLLDQGLSGWRSREGGAPGWKLSQGVLEVVPGKGDLLTAEDFSDLELHLEFWLPRMPHARGQDRANSGVFLQGRYEIQILDSWGDPIAVDGCGAIYKRRAPDRNASLPPEQWQSFDIQFTAARPGTPARITVHHNGVLIHPDVALEPTAGALDEDVLKPGPLLLQDHDAPVRFRNLWITPSRGSSTDACGDPPPAT